MDTALISFPIFGEGHLFDVPRYITVFGFRLYLYGLFITAGFALAALYLIRRHKVVGLTKDNVLDLVIMAVPCGLIGARLYYMLFNFDQYFGPGKWRNIIMFREGGLAIYGGVIGGAIAFLIYARVRKINFGKLLDAAGFGLFIGQAVGRWGNFFNREAYGIATDAPWRMGLSSGGVTTYVHPTFLYEALWNVIGLIIMHVYSKRSKAKYRGQYFLFYVAWYGFGRFMIEGIRTDSLFISGTDIRVSQLLAALSFSVAAILLVRNHLRGKQSPDDEELEPDDVDADLVGEVLALSDEDLWSDDEDDLDPDDADAETGDADGPEPGDEVAQTDSDDPETNGKHDPDDVDDPEPDGK